MLVLNMKLWKGMRPFKKKKNEPTTWKRKIKVQSNSIDTQPFLIIFTAPGGQRGRVEIRNSNLEHPILNDFLELEKFKFVLDYKIKELKKQIEPREREIRANQEQIHEMESELERFHKSNTQLELALTESRQKLRVSQKSHFKFSKIFWKFLNFF